MIKSNYSDKITKETNKRLVIESTFQIGKILKIKIIANQKINIGKKASCRGKELRIVRGEKKMLLLMSRIKNCKIKMLQIISTLGRNK